MAKDKKKSSGGLTPKTRTGLNKKRIAQKRGGSFKRLGIGKGETKTVQFLTPPDQMKEFDQHVWREGGKWNFVPCAEDNCPLCEDEDPQVSKTSYQFAANVWSFKDKAVKIVTGGQDLAGRVMFRYERKKSAFMKKTWDISKFDTQPVTMDVDTGDKTPLRDISNLELFDLDEYVKEEMLRYYGEDDMPGGKKKKTPKRSSLDDDDEDDEDEGYEEDELLEMDWKELKEVATGLGVKLVDKNGEKRKRTALVKLIMKKQ